VRLAVISPFDVNDRCSWSGLPWTITQALATFADVEQLPQVRSPALRFALRCESFVVRKTLHRLIDEDHHPFVAAASAGHFSRELVRRGPFDGVVAIAAMTQIAWLCTKLPIFAVGDATLRLLIGYYAHFTGYIGYSERLGLAVEGVGVRHATHFYASHWAAASAVRDFGQAPERVHVVPFGANLVREPSRAEATDRKADRLRLLFLGVDWERKGGPIAWRTFELLRARGIDATLTVCGCVPPDAFRHEHATIIPRIDKSKPDEAARFDRLLLESDLLLLPSRAECFGLVYAEAAAYGVPSIATDTGGVSDAVRENGRLLPLDAGPAAYADVIAELWADRAALAAMRIASRDRYERVLNWGAWARDVAPVIERGVHG